MAYYRNFYQAPPPGILIKEQLDEKHITKDEFVKKMHITKEKAEDILTGKCELTYMIAIQLEEVLGVSARYWINQETLYRERIKHAHNDKI